MRAGLLCVMSLLLAAACGAPPQPAPPAVEVAPVWERYRAAAGGEALRQVRGLRVTGVSVDPNDRANRRLLIDAEAPARFRLRETSEAPAARGLRQLVGYNGTVGWRAGNTLLGGDGLSEDPATRDRAITAAGRQNYINFIAGVMPIWLQEAGLTLTTIGTLPDGPDRGATAVTVAQDGAELGRLVFDQRTGLPKRLIVPYLRSIRSEGGEYTVSFDDYRDAGQGVRLPYRLSRDQGGTTVQWIIRAYQINPGFPAGTFDAPTNR